MFRRHALLQSSVSTRLPSSHSSPLLRTPLPQNVAPTDEELELSELDSDEALVLDSDDVEETEDDSEELTLESDDEELDETVLPDAEDDVEPEPDDDEDELALEPGPIGIGMGIVTTQRLLHESPSTLLPSSQASVPSTVPLPQPVTPVSVIRAPSGWLTMMR